MAKGEPQHATLSPPPVGAQPGHGARDYPRHCSRSFLLNCKLLINLAAFSLGSFPGGLGNAYIDAIADKYLLYE